MMDERSGFNNPEEAGRGAPTAPDVHKSHKGWIVAGLAAASVALAVCVAFVTLWTFGLHAARLTTALADISEKAEYKAKHGGIVGLWYETEGYGTIEFFSDGSFRISASDYYWETGTYEYDAAAGTGEYTSDDSYDTVSIKLEDGLLNIEDASYTTEYVEQVEFDWDTILDYWD